MAIKLSVDRVLFGAAVALVLFGLVMTYSASALLAHETHRSSWFFLMKQGAWAGLGLLVMWRLMRIDYRVVNHRGVLYGLLGVTAILLTVVLFLPEVKSAHRWLRLGWVSFQPSELAKLTLVVTVADQLARRLDRLEAFRTGVLPSLVTTGALALLVLVEPDLGTAFTMVAVMSAVFFVAGAPLRHLLGLAAAAVPVVCLSVWRFPYMIDRLIGFLFPERDPLGKGFHMIQSQIAVGTGGLLGLGFMQSKQKFFYLPEPHTDFVYAVISEEWGFLGAAAVLAAFVVILWRGVAIARRAPDVFGTLLASGLTSVVVVQAFINMGVVLGLLPTTGIPLPFVSAGGSSMVASLAAVGLLLAISQHAR